jgi:DNA polymerase III delta prime subunit
LLGLANFKLGKKEGLEVLLRNLEACSQTAESDHQKARADAEKKAEEENKRPDEIKKLVKDAGKNRNARSTKLRKHALKCKLGSLL